MQKSNLLRHNVSHLVVFQSLIQTGNVTATAAELHMSQPAVSRALAHLREMFKDPLFVRAPGGVIPTERARELSPRVSDTVDDLADLLSDQAFDLKSTDRSFRIATTDYGASTVILDASKEFGKEAPKASLEIVPFTNDVFKDLAEGRLDLVLYSDAAAPESLRSEALFEESYSFIFRNKHPILKALKNGTIPLKSFLAWPHVLVTVFGGRYGEIDAALKNIGMERHIAMRLPYFSTAPLMVAQTDMLLTLPTRMAKHFARILKLQCLDTPIEIRNFGYRQIWHQRTDHDPAMIWLRKTIRVCSASREAL